MSRYGIRFLKIDGVPRSIEREKDSICYDSFLSFLSTIDPSPSINSIIAVCLIEKQEIRI